jgi:hypothetical protein
MQDHQAHLVAVGPVHGTATSPTSTTIAKASRFVPALSYTTGHRLVPSSLTSSSTAIGARPHLPLPPASQRSMRSQSTVGVLGASWTGDGDRPDDRLAAACSPSSPSSAPDQTVQREHSNGQARIGPASQRACRRADKVLDGARLEPDRLTRECSPSGMRLSNSPRTPRRPASPVQPDPRTRS